MHGGGQRSQEMAFGQRAGMLKDDGFLRDRFPTPAAYQRFVAHQPVIIVIAFFVVQWEASIPTKMLAVMPSAFVISVGVYELVVRRIGPLRAMFGMTSRRLDKAQIGTG